MERNERLDSAVRWLVDDLRDALVFVPNRSHDLYSFMQKYIAECQGLNQPEVLKDILGNILHCANGEPYDDPHPERPGYTTEDVDVVEAKLKEFADAAYTNPDAVVSERLNQKLVEELLQFNSERGHALLDTARREAMHQIGELGLEHATSSLEAANRNPIQPQEQDMGGM